MSSTRPIDPWRGLVHQLTYATDLSSRVADETIERIVDAVLQQRVFSRPAETYYEAAVAALGSGRRIADLDGQDEEVTRDALTRIVEHLDARRPWPVHPFYRQDPHLWDDLAGAPVIGRLPLSQMAVRQKLSRVFDTVGGPDGIKVLILQLRSGQVVALRSTEAFTAPGVDLLATSDPAVTIADFQELTGLPVEPR